MSVAYPGDQILYTIQHVHNKRVCICIYYNIDMYNERLLKIVYPPPPRKNPRYTTL